MSIKPIGLTSAFTFAVIALFCRADNAFIGFFAIAGCAEILLASFAIGALISCVLLAFTRQAASGRIARVILWTLVSLVGIFVAWMGTNAEVSFCATIGGVFIGLGTVGMLGQWAWCFSRFPREDVLPTIACSMLLTAVFWFVLRLLNGFIPICMGLALCTACAGVAAVIEGVSTRDKDRDEEALKRSSANRNRLEVRAALTSFESFVYSASSHMGRWHAMESGCALVLGFFMTGAAYWSNTLEMELPVAFAKPMSYLIAVVVVFIVGRFATSVSYQGRDERQPMRVVLVVAACTVFAGAFMSALWGNDARLIVRMCNFFSLALLNVYGISTIFIDLMASGISPARSCVVAACLCYAGMALGILAYLVLGSFVCFAVALMAVAYAALVIVIAVQAVHGGRTNKDYRRQL